MPLSPQDALRRVLQMKRVAVWTVLVSLACSNGCSYCRSRAKWEDGTRGYEKTLREVTACSAVRYSVRRPSYDAAAVHELLQAAGRLEAARNPACVDLYFAATCRLWDRVAALGEFPARDDLVLDAKGYNACLAKLLTTARTFGRLDPLTGLHVMDGDRPIAIPVELHGFAWSAEDFNEIELVGDYRLNAYTRPVRSDGVGVPLLVRRCRTEEERFFRQVQPFSATAVLRMRPVQLASASNGPDPHGPFSTDLDASASDVELVLEFYNPATCRQLAGADRRWIVAGDLTAPFAWVAYIDPNKPIEAYLRPDGPAAKTQLLMIEPYQCGKIPVVFVHGLASDPTTWLTQIHALRAQPWFRERYQAWLFRYPTGIPFLTSAATLRRELDAAVTLLPGAANDPAVHQMVLIGHSMGGLVSKLQVAESGTDLWDVASNRPLDEINAEPADRERLREVFFFAPLPFVRKVIFIGTPHRGSSMASRTAGRVSSWLAEMSAQTDERHRRLAAANPGVFAPWIAKKIPTSVDLLEPEHPLLQAIEKLPVDPRVELHSIIGVADLRGADAPGDGVVSLTSARYCGAISEKRVAETHRGLLQATSTTIEIERILERQLQEAGVGLVATEFDPFE
jgi:pimeloyl-ACP methyl ester carboxylesterase